MRIRTYSLVVLSSALLLLSACSTSDTGEFLAAATGSHTGAAPAVHMELKQDGVVKCKVYNTAADANPVINSCPSGDYVEQLFDEDWQQVGPNKNVTVSGVASTPPADGSGTHTGAAPAVHMQLKDNEGAIVCKVYNTPASIPPTAENCPSGSWTEQLFDENWQQIGPNKTVTVGGPTAPPPSSSTYKRVFTEDFNGSSLSGSWETPPWPGTEIARHVDVGVDFRRDQCVVSDGKLKVRATLDGSRVRSCYAHTDETFGPGSGQLKIEYRVNLSRVQAEGGWFAAWLNTLSSEGNPYDNDVTTGTEIDVVEYVPFEGAYAYSNNGIDTRNSFHPAVHTVDDGGGGIISPDTKGNGFYDASKKGIDLRSGYHTFGLEWNAECQVFSVDGQPVWTNREGVSSAEVHRLMLTMEMSNAGDTGYNNWGFASGRYTDNLQDNPAEALVDWVRVDRKSTPDADLCN